MCSPEHFAVEYAINPWMDVTTPVDAELAVKQWDRLRETLAGLGHEVHQLTPEPGLPDMVYAANGAFVVDGTAYGAQFKHEQRAAEAAAHRAFYEAQGWRFIAPILRLRRPVIRARPGVKGTAPLRVHLPSRVLGGFGPGAELGEHRVDVPLQRSFGASDDLLEAPVSRRSSNC